MGDPDNNQTGPQSHPDTAEWDEVARAAANVLGEIARTSTDLSARIEDMAAAIRNALQSGTSVVGADNLFVQAQEFIDQCIAQAQQQAAQVLADAHAQADQIVKEGLERTRQLIGQAPLTAFMPTEAVQQLEQTIDSFSRSNSEVMNQFAKLRGRHGASEPEAQGPHSDEPPPLHSQIA
jgi:cell division septum initiation protein DivIVA